MIRDLANIVSKYTIDIPLKLRDWIPIEKLDCRFLSRNPAAIHLLEANPDKINWIWLSSNPAAIHLLEANKDKIDWDYLSGNPAAIHLVEANKDKIDWIWLSENPSIFEIDTELYKKMVNKMTNIIVE